MVSLNQLKRVHTAWQGLVSAVTRLSSLHPSSVLSPCCCSLHATVCAAPARQQASPLPVRASHAARVARVAHRERTQREASGQRVNPVSCHQLSCCPGPGSSDAQEQPHSVPSTCHQAVLLFVGCVCTPGPPNFTSQPGSDNVNDCKCQEPG
jgi:hypothetical protein